jgi:hypothetical protein
MRSLTHCPSLTSIIFNIVQNQSGWPSSVWLMVRLYCFSMAACWWFILLNIFTIDPSPHADESCNQIFLNAYSCCSRTLKYALRQNLKSFYKHNVDNLCICFKAHAEPYNYQFFKDRQESFEYSRHLWKYWNYMNHLLSVHEMSSACTDGFFCT